MTLTTIFFIVCGVCVLGIMVALWILQQEAAANAGIQKLSPDELKNYDPATETLKNRQGGTATQAPPKKSAKPKRPRVALQGLFGGQKGAESPVRLDAIEAAPDLPGEIIAFSQPGRCRTWAKNRWQILGITVPPHQSEVTV